MAAGSFSSGRGTSTGGAAGGAGAWLWVEAWDREGTWGCNETDWLLLAHSASGKPIKRRGLWLVAWSWGSCSAVMTLPRGKGAPAVESSQRFWGFSAAREGLPGRTTQTWARPARRLIRGRNSFVVAGRSKPLLGEESRGQSSAGLTCCW